MAQALYRRWRPQTWGAVVGQGHVIQTLRNAVKGDRVAHAYLFAGPRGTGMSVPEFKADLARPDRYKMILRIIIYTGLIYLICLAVPVLFRYKGGVDPD